MMKPFFAKAFIISSLLGFTCFINAQANNKPENPSFNKVNAKPFKVLTNGRQITLQAKEQMKTLMVWTSDGHRIVEQKEINGTTHSFVVPLKENVVFILIEFANGNRFTEKIGVK